jgi:hypothetical protein
MVLRNLEGISRTTASCRRSAKVFMSIQNYGQATSGTCSVPVVLSPLHPVLMAASRQSWWAGHAAGDAEGESVSAGGGEDAGLETSRPIAAGRGGKLLRISQAEPKRAYRKGHKGSTLVEAGLHSRPC